MFEIWCVIDLGFFASFLLCKRFLSKAGWGPLFGGCDPPVNLSKHSFRLNCTHPAPHLEAFSWDSALHRARHLWPGWPLSARKASQGASVTVAPDYLRSYNLPASILTPILFHIVAHFVSEQEGSAESLLSIASCMQYLGCYVYIDEAEIAQNSCCIVVVFGKATAQRGLNQSCHQKLRAGRPK